MEYINEYTSSEDTESESEDTVHIRQLNIYLQNFANQLNMSTIFMYLPWYPSLRMLRHMKNISNTTLKYLRDKQPQLFDMYSWDIIGVPSKEVEGVFSMANSTFLRNFHITMHSNVRGEKHRIKQYIENLKTSVRHMDIPLLLIAEESARATREANLKRLLFKETNTQPKRKTNVITLPLSDTLSIFKSQTSKNLFISCKVRKTTETYAFFENLDRIIRDNIDLLGLQTQPMPIEGQTYHVSMIIAELKNPGFNLPNTAELERLISELDVSKQLEQVKISIDSMMINEISDERQSHKIHFNT